MKRRTLQSLLLLTVLGAALPIVSQGADLTISDGVVVKFGADSGFVVRDSLRTSGQPIFTSVKDDVVGGQTGGAPQTATAGDWRGLQIEASAYNLQLDGLGVRYGGANGESAFSLRKISPTLRYLSIKNSVTGIRVTDGAAPRFEGLSLVGNNIGFDADRNAAPVITGSDIHGNTLFGVRNLTPSTIVQATGNWWGQVSGPKDSVGNPQGQGDVVSTGISYGQFLAEAPLINPTIRLVNSALYIEQSTVAVQIACTNAVEYRIAENNNFSGIAFQALADGKNTINVPLSSGDGRKQLSVQFRNAAGTITSATLTGGVLVDTQAPQLAITNPAAGSIISKSIAVDATASDGSGINRVEFYLDGALQKTATTSPYSFNWNTDLATEGAHALLVIAYDEASRSTQLVRNVTFSREVLPPDTVGPAAIDFKFSGSPIANGATLTRTGTITADISDQSGVAHIDVLLDGMAITTMTGASGSYSAALNLDNIANGSHVLVIRAQDSLSNVSTTTFNITVAHAVPNAPQIGQSLNGSTTRYKDQTITGQAQANSQVQLYINNNPVGSVLSVGNDGNFSAPIVLVAGINQIQATAKDQYGTSPLSTALSMTLDISVPAAPSNLTATAQIGGKIKLSWTRSSDPNAISTGIYRAASAFATTGEAIKIGTLPVTTTTYDDLPSQDGVYYYRLISLNNAGTPSNPTNQAQAAADSQPPHASVVYTPLGKVDAATGRIGQGKVNVALTVTEALQAIPYFAVVPNGSAPISVNLIKQDDTHYTGSFTVDATSGSGTANVLFSARDVVGNRGTDVDAGATLKIDTEGPSLTGISITPSSPIKNDSAQTVAATFTLSKAMKTGQTPQLSYLLSGPVRSPVALANITQVNATTWSGNFTLPSDAGLASPETFAFAFRGVDDLDNISTNISTPNNRFQVYQGNLPPLLIPLGLKAEAKPGGKARLTWLAVDDASAYQIYRQGPTDATLVATQRTTGIEYLDSTPQDGKYTYAIATVRQANGQESLSSQSATVDVTTSANAPAAPQNLSLMLVGAGIQATWQPPLNSTVASYNLYRSNASSIGTTAGLTPIKTGIKQLGAIDANPSPSEHAYAATALDAAGNESALSNSSYLNFNLLPVATLKVEQLGNALPQLSWTPSKSGNVGYNVYIGLDATKLKLTSTPTAGLTFQDTGYTSGERRYTVAVVDSNNVEQPRTITLPNISTQVVSGMPIKRGVMNRLQVQVTNTSSATFDNATVVIHLDNIDHRSDVFGLAANETRMIPVVVGGYADLQANAPMQVGVEIVPNEGELVRISKDTTADIADSSLVVGMATEEFTRGGIGKVHLTIENTTDVDVELLTARSNGIIESDELRFKLLDADGNVLAAQPYKQVFGANVITLSTGQTVARIAAGATYVSDVFNLNVPNVSLNSLRVKLEVDKLRYHTGQPDAVVIAGHGSEKTVSLIDTAYYGEVTDVNPITSFGDQNVVITGRALDRQNNAPLPNTRLKLVLNQQGFERIFSVLTDGAGNFAYTFVPTITDSGLYKVSAVHPDITDRPEQKSFTINRVTVGPTPYKLDVPKNYPFTIPFTAKAGPGTAATNLRLTLDAASQVTGQLPAGINVQLPTPVTLAEKQTLNVPVIFSATNDAQPTGSLIMNVISDEHPLTPIGQVRVNYTLSEAKPFLTGTPSFIQTGLPQGGSQIESLVVANKGLQDALNLQFTLTKPDGSAAPSWVSLTNQSNGTLVVGGQRNIDVSFNPPADLPDGVYEFRIGVKGDNVPQQSLNVYASVTQSGQGNVLFKVADMYTATVGKDGKLIPGLAGATITMQNEDVATVSQDLVTDSIGEALFQNLPAGSYKFRARAANHQEIGGRLLIKPGITANQPVFLDYNLITVEWSVREVTIQDRYDITLSATFETDVPAAVVVMQPASTNLPKMNAGDVYYGELTLTNYGLINAEHVKQQLPSSDGFFRYEFLVEIPVTLAPKQRVTIPYRVVALKSLDGSDSGASSGGGCYSYSNATNVTCDFTCANGNTSSCGSSSSWFSGSNSSCPAGGTGGGSGNGPGGGSWGGGWGGSSLTTIPMGDIPPCVKCQNGQCCGAGGGSGGSGGGGSQD